MQGRVGLLADGEKRQAVRERADRVIDWLICSYLFSIVTDDIHEHLRVKLFKRIKRENILSKTNLLYFNFLIVDTYLEKHEFDGVKRVLQEVLKEECEGMVSCEEVHILVESKLEVRLPFETVKKAFEAEFSDACFTDNDTW